MRTGKYSKQEDDSIIKLRAQGKTNQEIASTLGRGLESLKGRVKTLVQNNLITYRSAKGERRTKGKNLRRWEEKEKQAFMDMRTKHMPYSLISKKLNRSVDSIQQMAVRLMKEDEGINSRNPPADMKIYSFDSETATIGLMLWWAEGTKKGRNVQFVNSSPEMVKIYLRFLKEIGVDFERTSARVKVMNSSQLKNTQKYWSEITGIPIKKFTKPIIRGKNIEKGYEDDKGCITITYCSINLKRQMEKKIEEITQNILTK